MINFNDLLDKIKTYSFDLLDKITKKHSFDYIAIESVSGIIYFKLIDGILNNVELTDTYSELKGKNVLFFSENEKIILSKKKVLFLTQSVAKKEALVSTQSSNLVCFNRKYREIYAYPFDKGKELNFNIISGFSLLLNTLRSNQEFKLTDSYGFSFVLPTDNQRYFIFNAAFDEKWFNTEISVGSDDYIFQVEEYKNKYDIKEHYELFYEDFVQAKNTGISYHNIREIRNLSIKIDSKIIDLVILAVAFAGSSFYAYKSYQSYTELEKIKKQISFYKTSSADYQQKVKVGLTEKLSILGYELSVNFEQDFANIEKLWQEGTKISLEGSSTSSSYQMKLPLFNKSERGTAELFQRIPKERINNFIKLPEIEGCQMDKTISGDGMTITAKISCDKDNKFIKYMEAK
jgi:hypothetical protein